jgi:hypothetical protein
MLVAYGFAALAATFTPFVAQAGAPAVELVRARSALDGQLDHRQPCGLRPDRPALRHGARARVD